MLGRITIGDTRGLLEIGGDQQLPVGERLLGQFDGARHQAFHLAAGELHLAQEGGADVGALVQGILAARFVEGRDVADDAVIRDVLAATGHDPGIADRGLFTGAEIYGRNLERAVAAGVFGSPFYIVAESGEMFWGQDRLDYLDRHLAAL